MLASDHFFLVVVGLVLVEIHETSLFHRTKIYKVTKT